MSLKQAAKERLLWAIRQVVTPFGRVIMLVDPMSLKIVSSCCQLSDVLDEGVDLVEVLTKRREPLKSKNVLCILSDLGYLDLLLKDFTPGKEHYMGVFIMFNCHLRDDSALRKIAQNMSFEKVLGCVELFLNFVPFESNIFYSQISSLQSLYGGSCYDSYVSTVSSKIVSLCNVLNLTPSISFHDANSQVIKLICHSVTQLISETIRGKSNLKPCDLIVFDRSTDFTPVFIHEFTYQALVYDLLNIPYSTVRGQGNCFQGTNSPLDSQRSQNSNDNTTDTTGERVDNCYEFKVVGSDRVERRVALLDAELDVLWAKYRHMHIQEVNTLVLSEIDKFKKTPGGKAQSMLEQMRNLPNLQYLIEKYWAHLNLTNECFNQVQKRDLIRLSELEQTIATSLDSKMKSTTHAKLFDKLVSILNQSNNSSNMNQSYQLSRGPDKKLMLQNNFKFGNVEDVSETPSLLPDDKVRLILLYLCNYNVGVGGLKELLKVIQLDYKAVELLQRVLKSLPIMNNGSGKPVHKLANDGIINYYKKLSVEYDSSRFVSHLTYTLDQYLKHDFHHEHITPYNTHNINSGNTVNSGNSGNIGNTVNNSNSGNRVKGVRMELSTFDVLLEREEGADDGRRRVLVYVLGGVTFSECREIYKIMNKRHVEIYFGGDEIVIPAQLLQTF
ncbi:Sec1 family protein [Theileria parva strain Muguga]|uniref:Syntaxin binding protein, putative n=1 Tax=Theileria parva TaxID=5875 RepID=Q4N0L3_THEPA|nr:Sec1 family protein [Theileria parva strain Muguga]EAN30843.1 Sec1 family protein [Theileria parva strain Muguga]|eukprot:XP_763126.1 syntaxin binding protein [Theileria parva strain Muguga]